MMNLGEKMTELECDALVDVRYFLKKYLFIFIIFFDLWRVSTFLIIF